MMDAARFVEQWKQSTLTERSGAQQHYLALCDLFAFPKPVEADPAGDWYTFEKGVQKSGGGQGFADVWKRNHFAWEYKRKGKSLEDAFRQLKQYQGNLENPPLLVACDIDRIVIETAWNGQLSKRHEITLDQFAWPAKLELLRKLFHEHEALKPAESIQEVTAKAIGLFKDFATDIRKRTDVEPTRFAHFLTRLVFCLFAEDAHLLPDHAFAKIVEKSDRDIRHINQSIAQLFAAMATGGPFGVLDIPHFNGSLFDDAPTFDLSATNPETLKKAATYDWSQMDCSIFGTLFERVMDPDQRSQLGAHYTSQDDIATLVEPVVMAPLRREWEVVAAESGGTAAALSGRVFDGDGNTAAQGGGRATPAAISAFLARLRSVRVLDPACGSGNFLYVTLKKMLDLEFEILTYCREHGLPDFELQVGPHQFLGLETNPFAHDIAQMTLVIGELQWRIQHGYPITRRPILRRLDTIRKMDAILDQSDPSNPREPDWPDADFIIGNPPFLGSKVMRSGGKSKTKTRTGLGDAYVDALFKLWRDRVRPEADLCCYWFEKARAQIERGKAQRAGLLATQGIRGGASRATLERIGKSASIFFAESDRDWVLNGASVHVSMIGFDDGAETTKVLDGQPAATIHANLSDHADDLGAAKRLAANADLGFMGDTKGGPFDLDEKTALAMLRSPNPHGRPNSDVVVPWVNGLDVTRRPRDAWIIDFGPRATLEEAALYESPFSHIREHVYPMRQENKRAVYKDRWWIHVEARPALLNAVAILLRFIATARVAKHRIFVWMNSPTLPDCQLIVFARSDDYFFGVLHSRAHEVWARAQGTQVRERESGFRYTPTTCFETFPLPEPTPAQTDAIAAAAKRLDELRSNWLNPPEWTRTETLEFPGSLDGPWRRFVHDPDDRGIGIVRYPRLVPRDEHAGTLAKRTLTALYNKPPTWLDHAHRALDAAVFAAYGWPHELADDDLLTRLLALNLQRSASRAP